MLAWIEPPVVTCGSPQDILLHVSGEPELGWTDPLELEGSF